MPSLLRSTGGWIVLGAAVFGWFFESGAGFLAGAAIGAVWGSGTALTSRIGDLERELRQVRQHADGLEEQMRRWMAGVAPPPAAAVPTPPPSPPAAAAVRTAEPTGGVEAAPLPPPPARTSAAPTIPAIPPPAPPPVPAFDAAVARPASAPNPLLAAVMAFCTTGNLVAKVGVLILFVGVAFLVRFAADRGLLPIEFRLMGLTVAAVAALVFGWRLRRAQPDYAMVVQGGSVGVLYLTIFAAFRL